MKSQRLHQLVPVVSFLGEQLLELAQRDHPPSDRRPVRYELLAEVIRHSDVFTRLLLAHFMPADGKTREAECEMIIVLNCNDINM